MQDKYVKECPYCGGTEMVEACNMYAAASSIGTGKFKMNGAKLYHCVCKNCGSILRSYIDPEKAQKMK